MLSLKIATEEDFLRITDFYKFVIQNCKTMPVYCRWVYGQHPTDEMIRRYIGEGTLFYTEREGEILSAIAVLPYQKEDYHGSNWEMELADDEVVTVHILCTAPGHQRQGIARQTMEAVIEISKKWGKKAVRLDALDINIPAQRLYESMAFIRGDTKHWYFDNLGWADFFLYEKLI